MTQNTPEALIARLEALEAQAAIRRVMARYMELCDRLDAATPMAELGQLFTHDAEWAGQGEKYGAAFGGHVGRDAILAMLETYRQPQHFAFNAHFLTSETINVTGATATGSWMMLQTSTFASGVSFLTSASLAVGFSLDGGAWRIARFATTNLFSRPVSAWNDPSPLPVPAQPKTSQGI